jgi:hypothetical protein
MHRMSRRIFRLGSAFALPSHSLSRDSERFGPDARCARAAATMTRNQSVEPVMNYKYAVFENGSSQDASRQEELAL